MRQQKQWEPLGQGMAVQVSKEHRFGTDTILLSWFSHPRPAEKRAAELCAGCGALSLLWFRAAPASLRVDAVEIQEEACRLLRRSVEANGLEDRYFPILADLRCLKPVLKGNGYDLVACNPPYTPLGAGITNCAPALCTARHESQCTIEDVTQAAARLLRPLGRLCLCQRPERLYVVMQACSRAGLVPKRLRLVQHRLGKAPKLFLLEARKGGRPGGLVVEPTLILEDEQGKPSREMEEIYGEYARKEGLV